LTPARAALAGLLSAGLAVAGAPVAGAAEPAYVSGTLTEADGAAPVAHAVVLWDNFTCASGDQPAEDFLDPDELGQAYVSGQTGRFGFGGEEGMCYLLAAGDLESGEYLDLSYAGQIAREVVAGPVPAGGLAGLDIRLAPLAEKPLLITFREAEAGSVVDLVEINPLTNTAMLTDSRETGEDELDPAVWTGVAEADLSARNSSVVFQVRPGATYAVAFNGDSTHYAQIPGGTPLSGVTVADLRASAFTASAGDAPFARSVPLAAGSTVTGRIAADLGPGGTYSAATATAYLLHYDEEYGESNWISGPAVDVGADGTYSIGGLEPGGTYTISIAMAGFRETLLGDVAGSLDDEDVADLVDTFTAPAAGGSASVANITLSEPGAAISGSLTGFDQRAVELYAVNTKDWSYWRATIKDGAYTFTGLAPGVYWVGAEEWEYGDWSETMVKGAHALVEAPGGALTTANLRAADYSEIEGYAWFDLKVKGLPAVAQTLTAETDSEYDQIEYEYAWTDGTQIIGTGKTYQVERALKDSDIYAVVVGRGEYLIPEFATVEAGTVESGAPARPVVAPRLQTDGGRPRVGQPIEVSESTWSPNATTATYQWLRDGQPITGATSATYVPDGADLGRDLSMTMPAKVDGPDDATLTVPAAAAVAAGAAVRFTPAIEGIAAAGRTVTAVGVPDGWAPQYQWFSGGKPLAGATGESYALQAQDGGKALTVRVTAHRVGFDDSAAVSAAVAVPLTPGAAITAAFTPQITGSAKVGQILSATPGSPAGWTTQTAWYRDSKQIAGAAGATYKVTAADAGAKLAAVVVYGREGYTGAAKATAAKTVAKIAPTLTVSLSKTTARRGEAVTAKITHKAKGLNETAGKIKIKVGPASKTITLKALKKAKGKVKLPAVATAGNHAVKVTYTGSKQVAKKTKKAGKLKVG
jgi:hypothetical protein